MQEELLAEKKLPNLFLILASPLCPLLLQHLPSSASLPFSLISCAEEMNKFRRKARTLQAQLNALTVLTLIALTFLMSLQQMFL